PERRARAPHPGRPHQLVRLRRAQRLDRPRGQRRSAMMSLANAASPRAETASDGDWRWEHIRIRLADSIMTVTLDHPPANALPQSMFDAVDRAIALLQGDAVRVAIVTGEGATFSIGADVRGLLGAGPMLEEGRRIHRQLQQIERATKPIIAAING